MQPDAASSKKIFEAYVLAHTPVFDPEADFLKRRRSNEQARVTRKSHTFAGNAQHLVETRIAIFIMQHQQRIIAGRHPLDMQPGLVRGRMLAL